MHRISRAPVLSATRSRDSCWITGVSYVCQFFECDRSLAERWWAGPAEAGPAHSLGLFEDLHDPPPLGGGERTGLHQEHAVTDPACVLLVVHLELAGAPQNLAVEGVLDAVLDLDDNGLVHLVADHEALTDLT